MTYQEKIAALTKLFGDPVAELPRDWRSTIPWDGPQCLVFWADARKWNSVMLNHEAIPFRFAGPHKAGTAPFPTPKYDGYSILVEME